MEFKWAKGYPAKLSADEAAIELEMIRSRESRLTADVVVSAAESEASPLHVAFEWDDKDAAHEHRKAQARAMMRALILVEEKPTNEPREHRMLEYLASPPADPGRGQYLPVSEILTDEDSRAALLSRARREAESYQKRYADLVELADVFVAMKAAFGD